MPEWLVERGIGETRAVLVDRGEIIESRVQLDGATPAGSVIAGRLANTGLNSRNAVAIAEGGVEYLLPRGAPALTQGATLHLEVTREAIPGAEPWKRPLARATSEPLHDLPSLAERLGGREIAFPAPSNRLDEFGWFDLLDEARTGMVRFAGGELRISPTPAMTLIDIDGYLAADELAVLGASEAAAAIRRLDIGGSIGVDLPTSGNKGARHAAAEAIDELLTAAPFERTAVNGFGFVQIVRPRTRPSLVELAQDRPAFEARALIRRVATEGAGSRRLVAHPGVIALVGRRPEWTDALARQIGGRVELRADPALPMSGGYAEAL